MLTDLLCCPRGHCAVLQGDLRISCTRLAACAACWGLRAHFVVEVLAPLASSGCSLCTGGLVISCFARACCLSVPFAHFCLRTGDCVPHPFP